MPRNRGIDLLLQYLIARQVPFLTGNPGSTESPLLDRLRAYPQIDYILALHETVAVGIAEAYALASGRVGVVNLHAAPGLGNALGMLYNALVGCSPLLVTAGQQDTRMRLRHPLLAHDLVAMAAPVTRWSVEAHSADELPLLLHRAFQVALGPPAGPVFVALPINVLEQETDQRLIDLPRHFNRTAPDPEAVEEAVSRLLAARQPAVVFGDEVVRSGAQEELLALVESLGAPAWGTLLSLGIAFPMTHPQYRGELPDNHRSIRECLGEADLILLVGGDFFREVFYSPDPPWPEGAALIQLEAAPSQLSQNSAVQLGIASDLRLALGQVQQALTSRADKGFREASASRRARLEQLHAREVEERSRQLRQVDDRQPMHPARFVAGLREVLPKGTIVVSEALSVELEVMGLLDLHAPGDFFGSRGGGIGQGLPGGVGVKLAFPDRPVAVLSGDGSALYTLQTLWTAAHHRLPILFIILNNRSYRILKQNMDRFRQFFGVAHHDGYPFMDLTDPHIDFVSLAAGFGVPGQKIERPDQIGPALEAAVAAQGPYLLDAILEG
jgi:benzoylformate decarboxylase